MAQSKQLDLAAENFRRFASILKVTYQNSSPLYQRLSTCISEDSELLRLASAVPKPDPSLFLGAVQFLLLNGRRHYLSAFYPSITNASSPEEDPYPHFRSFCFQHAKDLQKVMRTRLVQTNEVKRCALLLPAFHLITRIAGGRPLALIDIGASAGLNLLWDHYGYSYRGLGFYGDRDSEVQLECELRGTSRPVLSAKMPAVTFRVGVDLNPIDLNKPEDVTWLRALIWPEHANRRRLLDCAIRIAKRHTLPMVKGDALQVLPEIAVAAPTSSTLCVFSTFTLCQCSRIKRGTLASTLDKLSNNREFYFVYVEYEEETAPELHLLSFKKKTRTNTHLAYCHPHGEWLEWIRQSKRIS